MKKLLLLTALVAVSCTEKASVNCEEPVRTEVTKSYRSKTLSSKTSGSVSLTRDKTVEGNYVVNGDLNLNGHRITVYGLLKVNGNLNGGGTYEYCSLEVSGAIQNNPIKNKLNCSTLGLEEVVRVQEYYECE